MQTNTPFQALCPLVLASSSPRRLGFFRDLGLHFTALPPVEDEALPLKGEVPATYAARAAMAKARGAARLWLEQHPERDFSAEAEPAHSAVPLFVAADTIVVLDNTILGKPVSEEHALSMLSRLSGRTHTVITGCCLLRPSGQQVVFHDSTLVTFAAWPSAVLQAYIATGEPMDKAGAYGLQGFGAFLVAHLQGSWTNVVGLPVDKVIGALIELGAILPASDSENAQGSLPNAPQLGSQQVMKHVRS